MRNITTKLDINKQNYIKLDCMQNDDINLIMTLLENGVSYDLKNKTITLNWLKADSKVVIITSNRIVVNSNNVTIKLLRDCTRAVGQAKFELVIKDNASTQISTFPLSIDVTGSVLDNNEASKNVLTTMEDLENTIKQAEEDISKINAKGNDTYPIPSTSWVGSEPNLTCVINHKLNSKSLIIGVIDTDSQKSMFPDYRYIDMNSIEMQSIAKQNITVSINANYYSGKDANTIAQEVIDARKGEANLKAKIDKIDTSINTMNTDINTRQPKTDNTLTTANKTIVGAINGNDTRIKAWETFKSSGGDIGGALKATGFQVGNDNVVSYGSNSNGEYIRFYNGVQICMKSVAMSGIGCTKAWGNMYETGQLSLGNWALSFLETPKVNISMKDSQAGFIEMVNNTTITSVGHCTVARPSYDEGLIFKFDIIAIGRWK